MEARTRPGWGDVHLVHAALPVADLDRIDLSVEFLGRRLRAPLVIASMTGGHGAATEVNRRLAAAAQRHGLAMGVGSQRAALREPRLAASYSVAREAAPDAFLTAIWAPPSWSRTAQPPNRPWARPSSSGRSR